MEYPRLPGELPVVLLARGFHSGSACRNYARPDGAAVDDNDFYWIAGIEGAEIYRFNLEGKIDTIIPLPVEKPTKVVL